MVLSEHHLWQSPVKSTTCLECLFTLVREVHSRVTESNDLGVFVASHVGNETDMFVNTILHCNRSSWSLWKSDYRCCCWRSNLEHQIYYDTFSGTSILNVINLPTGNSGPWKMDRLPICWETFLNFLWSVVIMLKFLGASMPPINIYPHSVSRNYKELLLRDQRNVPIWPVRTI